MNRYELIGVVLGIIIFGTIVLAAVWAGRTDAHPPRRG
jgi:hypothetical protein